MSGSVLKFFACLLCLLFMHSYCMEEREHKDEEPPKRFESLRKSLLTCKGDAQKTQSTSKIMEIKPLLGRFEKLRQEINFNPKTKKLALNVPMLPYYFTSIKKVKNFIEELKSWGLTINYQFPDNGKTLAHYALDLNEFNLFHKSHHEKEMVEAESKEGSTQEANIEFHALPSKKYLELQYKFIKMLLSRDDIDLTIRDNNGDIPFGCFIKSLTLSSLSNKTEERIEAESIYIPKIFEAIIRHGYNKQFKQELYRNYKSDDLDLVRIKQRLCFFPLYENLNSIKEFVNDKLSTLKSNINTTDTLGTTILHRIFQSIDENIIFDSSNMNDIVALLDHICKNYKPDFSITNDYEETPIDCFFSSILASKSESEAISGKKDRFASKLSAKVSEAKSEESETLSRSGESTEYTRVIFKLMTLWCPCEIIRNAFISFSQEKQQLLASSLSIFPIFSEISNIEKNLNNEPDFLKIVDSEENNYLHYVVDFSKEYILLYDTVQSRLILIKLLLKNIKEDLILQKNKDNKFPLQIFICSVPINYHYKKTIRSILLKLAWPISNDERIGIINQCIKERLIFLKNVLSVPYKIQEKDLVRELLNSVIFKLTGT